MNTNTALNIPNGKVGSASIQKDSSVNDLDSMLLKRGTNSRGANVSNKPIAEAKQETFNDVSLDDIDFILEYNASFNYKFGPDHNGFIVSPVTNVDNLAELSKDSEFRKLRDQDHKENTPEKLLWLASELEKKNTESGIAFAYNTKYVLNYPYTRHGGSDQAAKFLKFVANEIKKGNKEIDKNGNGIFDDPITVAGKAGANYRDKDRVVDIEDFA